RFGESLASAEAAATAEAARAAAAMTAAAAGFRHGLRLHREETLALQFLARELPGAANGFRLLARFFLGGFFVVATQLHLAEDALALHFLLERLESLIDVIVANENLHVFCLFSNWDRIAAWALKRPAGLRTRRARKSPPISLSSPGRSVLFALASESEHPARTPLKAAPDLRFAQRRGRIAKI